MFRVRIRVMRYWTRIKVIVGAMMVRVMVRARFNVRVRAKATIRGMRVKIAVFWGLGQLM